MKHREWSLLYLVILTIFVAGLYAFEVPTSTLVYAVIALACPPMVIFTPGCRAAATQRVAAPNAATHAAPRPAVRHFARR